jgi:hypothetical protein
MQHKLFNFHALFHNWRFVVSEEMVALVLALFIFFFTEATYSAISIYVLIVCFRFSRYLLCRQMTIV